MKFFSIILFLIPNLAYSNLENRVLMCNNATIFKYFKNDGQLIDYSLAYGTLDRVIVSNFYYELSPTKIYIYKDLNKAMEAEIDRKSLMFNDYVYNTAYECKISKELDSKFSDEKRLEQQLQNFLELYNKEIMKDNKL